MKAYIEKVKAHDDMMKAELADYEIGKRHLANIMGEDPETFTQQDINRAIEYLLPSGIFEKKARPVMKDPYEIFPRQKAAQFGLDGRPYHWMYFTALPNYYSLLYDISWKLEELKSQEDELYATRKLDELEGKSVNLLTSSWIPEHKFQSMILEKIDESKYKHFLVMMERLASHPLSQKFEDFIMQYRDMHQLQSQGLLVPEIQIDSDGRSFAVGTGTKKQAEAKAYVYKPGTGKFSINNTDLSYFSNMLCRETIMFPLTLTNMVDAVDIVATVEYSGPVSQACAIRRAISMALTPFVDSDVQEQMRLSGMLTVDPRRPERKKPGQKKARKKFTWKKR
ncbi:hypothetical protein BsWGS_12496 [Bradybaena similaris]